MISLSGHPFQTEALKQYLAEAQQAASPGSHGVVTFAVDNDNVKVALVFANESGQLKFGVALAHDWASGNTAFGGSGSYSF